MNFALTFILLLITLHAEIGITISGESLEALPLGEGVKEQGVLKDALN